MNGSSILLLGGIRYSPRKDKIMDNFNLCWFLMVHLFGAQPHHTSKSFQKRIIHAIPQKMNVCMRVANKAIELGVDPVLAVSVAYHETRLREGLTSHAGAKGALGVIPKYHCPKPYKKCDLIKAGIIAIEKFLERNKYDLCSALAQYNRGLKGKCKKGRSEYNYAQAVLKTMKKLNQFMSPAMCYDPDLENGC